MQIIPLGGAAEVGASCTILDIAGARILIDVGIRVGSGSRKKPLPALELLNEPPDAVIVTHAHTDHTGALPIGLSHLGDSLIHMTTATLHLLEVLQGDAVRQMNPDDFDEESDRLFYDSEDVEEVMSRIVGVDYYQSFYPVPGRKDIVFEFAPSGHILGAGMLYIKSPEGRIILSGDYSVDPLPTIGAADLEWLGRKRKEGRIDFLMSEGTYGTAVHPPREKETEKFVAMLERIAKRGGKTLIPAFAVGRAQDITYVIREAKKQGKLDGVPLYLDGMVKPITNIYENIAHQTYPQIKEPLKLLDPELDIYKANAQSRAKLVSGEHEGPAIVISSSGMLVGGRSVEYARAFVKDRRNAILISGYQDEESPGKALLSLKRGGMLRLPDNEKVQVMCYVGRYHTSAHGDFNEISRLIKAAGPKKVALVHGDKRSLYPLKKELKKELRTVVLHNSRPFRMKLRRKWRKGRIKPTEQAIAEAYSAKRFAQSCKPTESEVRALWEYLSSKTERAYSETEIARYFLGPRYTPGEREILSDTLSDHRLYFITGSRIGQRSYKPRPETELVEMLVERGTAYQVPVEVGDVVVFSDGAPDLFVALVSAVKGTEIEGIIPFSPRKSFRRDWIKLKTTLNLGDLLRTKSTGFCVRYMEDLVREARALPDSNAVDAYYTLCQESGVELVNVTDCLPVFFPNKDQVYSTAMHIATALCMAGGGHIFSLASCGNLKARAEEEIEERWRLFGKIRHVRNLSDGEKAVLSDGRCVVPTGVYYADSFEAKGEDGEFTRIGYKHLALPEEGPVLLETTV